MLHRGVCGGLPLLLFVPVLQAKLAQHVEAYHNTGEVRSYKRSPRFLYRTTHFGRRMFAYVGANGASIDGLVRVPVGAMPYTFTTPTAVGFPAVADLLVIGDLATIHLTSPLCIASEHVRGNAICRTQPMKASVQAGTQPLYQSVSTYLNNPAMTGILEQ